MEGRGIEEPSARPFKTSFPRTLAKLEGEIRKLRATDAVIQVDVPPEHFRRDGRPYADAAWRSPRVALSMQTPYGALSYPCDTYDHWQDNVHAIALALEALRAVDRYGVTKRGEQYAGWKALPSQSTPTMTTQAAANVIANYCDLLNGR